MATLDCRIINGLISDQWKVPGFTALTKTSADGRKGQYFIKFQVCHIRDDTNHRNVQDTADDLKGREPRSPQGRATDGRID